MLASLLLVVVVIVIVFIANQAKPLSYNEFWDALYNDHAYSSVSKANDVWTASDTTKTKYVVNMHDINYKDTNTLDNYNVGIKTAAALNKNTVLSEAEKVEAWDKYVVRSLEEYNRVISGDYTMWSTHAEIKIEMNNRYAVSIIDYIYPVLLFTALIVFGVLIFRSMRASGNVASNFGKSKANISSTLKVRFSDVAGAEEEKEELAEIVEFLKFPAKFTAVGAKIPRGVLLVGRPGTGKTLFAKAVAGEANVPFFSISGSDFVEMFVGVGASRVRDLFDQAKKSQPCIVFIDEIDAVGRQRGAGLGGGNDEREQTLNQLLVQMDGFETNENVIVMAATNRADILDPALMRPGRFDRQVYVHVPDVRGREAIFKVHARNKPMSPDINFQTLARMTAGFTGADIANLLNESAILCARAGRTQIIMEDVFEGVDKVIMGAQKKSWLITEVDKRITAYHEAGHAVIAKKLAPYCDPVQEISIIPRGAAAGYTLMRPDKDDLHRSYKKLTSDIAMSMGGRCAEELVIQDISSGAVGDIKYSTDLARSMVTEWGMSDEVGPVFYGGSEEVFLGRDYGTSHTYSEAMAAKIDAEIAKIIRSGHALATKILTENRDKLDIVVRVLFEKETIYGEEFDMIMDGATAEQVIEFIDSRALENRRPKIDKTAEKH